MKIRTLPLACAALGAALLGGCAQQTGHVATVDLARIAANWPKFQRDNDQLNANADQIERSNAPAAVKARERDELRQQFADMQNEVEDDVQTAVKQIAEQRKFQLVVTREYVGYGGVDITADVEKALDITEKSPAPK